MKLCVAHADIIVFDSSSVLSKNFSIYCAINFSKVFLFQNNVFYLSTTLQSISLLRYFILLIDYRSIEGFVSTFKFENCSIIFSFIS